jgi:pyruvate-formate lyase-activating enzyme
VKEALASGDMGFLHSFTTGSYLDGPGARVVAWTTGCGWRCQYCHNPDTWTLRNGFPISVGRATEELRKYRQGLKKMSGGLTISGGDPLMQDRFVVKLLAAAHAMGVAYLHRDQWLLQRKTLRCRARHHRSRHARYQDLGRPAPHPAHRAFGGEDTGIRASTGRAEEADVGALRASAGTDR